MGGRVEAQIPSYDCDFSCRLNELLGGPVKWPVGIEGLKLGNADSILDYVKGILAIVIVIVTLMGIVFGLRVVFFQWIYYADQYNEDKLKEVKKNAWRIALGWGALVIGFIILNILDSIFKTGIVKT